MLAADECVAFNANLEADLRASCREVESTVNAATSKGYYVSSDVRVEQSDDDSVYMSDEDVDEEMESEYMDITTLPSHNSSDSSVEAAAAIASEEPSALAKLAASAVWTMLIARFDLPAPESLESLAHTLHFALEATQLPRVMTHLALFYLHRLLACADRADPVERQRFFEAAAISNKVTGSQFSAYHRLFTVALALADTYLDDHAYAGSAWSQVAGDRQSRLWNRFHMQSLDIINWRLEVSNNAWIRWRSWLGDWWRAVGVGYWSSGNKSSSAMKSVTTTITSSASESSRVDGNSNGSNSNSSTATVTLSPERTPVSDINFSLGTRSPLTPKHGTIACPTPSPVHHYPTYEQTNTQDIPSSQPLLTPASSYEDISSIKRAMATSGSSDSGRSVHSHRSTPEIPMRSGNRNSGSTIDSASTTYAKRVYVDRNSTNGVVSVKMSSKDVSHYDYSPMHRRASLMNSNNSGNSNTITTGYMIKSESNMLLSPQVPRSQPQRYHYSSTTGQLVTMEPHAFSYGSYYRC
jgi:hypothetical protein